MEDDFLLRWPQKGDSLFNKNDDGHHTIYLDPYVTLGPLGDNWAKYISGYKDAADILVNNIANNRSFQNSLAFPAIFLYRHFIELSLKLIIKYGHELYDVQNNYKEIHNLEELWSDCRLIIERKWPQENYEILDVTGNIIKEFSKIDLSSFESRYPEKKTTKGKKKKTKDKIKEIDKINTLTMEGIPNINFHNIKELIEKINNFLGGVGDAISIELSEKRDIESEYHVG